ncbi:uncharacterized protein LOC121779549 [Salvia splendens]|uniref:uncharacterized protein LOC121779549 n=1 Tax=Salvia splendens TaxID=180675 RepID=UPI001C261CF0|nr:uncharacterized protein LOC121779549 [Salvia splendens]
MKKPLPIKLYSLLVKKQLFCRRTRFNLQRRSGKGKGSLMKGSPVKKSRKKAVDAEDLNEDIMSCSEKGQWSLTKISPVKKSRRKTVVPEDLKEDIVILVLNVSLCLHKMMPDLLKYLNKTKKEVWKLIISRRSAEDDCPML